MILKHCYYYFKNALSVKFCNEVIRYANSKEKQLAVTGNTISKGRDLKLNPLTKKEIKNIQKIRKSNITWLDDYWIWKEIHPYITEANKASGWNFDWDVSESFQFTRYQPGQFYGWHKDSFSEPYNRPDNLNMHGKIRKLSVSCVLSNPEKDFTGGDLEFNINDLDRSEKENMVICKEARTQGSIIVFPSFVRHRVKKVKEGTRYSLVIWNLGRPFR